MSFLAIFKNSIPQLEEKSTAKMLHAMLKNDKEFWQKKFCCSTFLNFLSHEFEKMSFPEFIKKNTPKGRSFYLVFHPLILENQELAIKSIGGLKGFARVGLIFRVYQYYSHYFYRLYKIEEHYC